MLWIGVPIPRKCLRVVYRGVLAALAPRPKAQLYHLNEQFPSPSPQFAFTVLNSDCLIPLYNALGPEFTSHARTMEMCQHSARSTLER